MPTVTADFVKNKKVLLRYDLDVPIKNSKVIDDFRLKAGLPTLKLCLENAESVILMGHIGRPEGVEVPELSVTPIYDWLMSNGFEEDLNSGKLKLLENLRFEKGEESCDLEYSKELASLGDVYVNEAFAAYRPAASTTVLKTLMPFTLGLNFVKEIEKLSEIRENPKRPFIAIMGGAKIEDKVGAIKILSEKASAVLVGGKLAQHISEDSFNFPHNVLAAHLLPNGLDISIETIEAWGPLIQEAHMIVWNGPVGKVEDLENTRGTRELVKLILSSNAEVIVGGGDTVGFLVNEGLLGRFQEKGFVSSGGGAMLEFLTNGTLPTL